MTRSSSSAKVRRRSPQTRATASGVCRTRSARISTTVAPGWSTAVSFHRSRSARSSSERSSYAETGVSGAATACSRRRRRRAASASAVARSYRADE